MTTAYWLAIILSFGLAAVLTPVVRSVAFRSGILDDPASAPDRKRHKQPTALLGGWAIILATLITWWILAGLHHFSSALFPLKYLIGITVAGLFIFVGGWLDDWRHWTASRQLLWPTLATLATIAVGIGIQFITNPFGGLLTLKQWQIPILTWDGVVYHLTLWADLFTFVWLMGMMFTTKILDGLDGLVSGVGLIGAVVVFLLTLRPEVNQPQVALLALGLGGACAGFLIWNWHPAKIFLGESGALYIGFLLAVLSIISGGKIATALLIMGLPILDLAWVILQRLLIKKTSPFRTADRLHLHFQLLEAGLSVRQAVLLLYGVTLSFGLTTLWFHGTDKVVALGVLAIVLIALLIWITVRRRRQPPVSGVV